MPKLYRQLWRELYAIFGATLLILLAIILSFRLASMLHHASQGQMTLGALGALLALQALRFLALLAPLAFVLAAMLTLGRMQRDLELSAWTAGGLGYLHQVKALFYAALPLACLLFYWQFNWQSSIYRQQEWLYKKAQQEAALLLFTPQQFRTLKDGSVVHSAHIDETGVQNFFLWRPEGEGFSLLSASSGQFQTAEARRWFALNHGQRLAFQDGIFDYAHFAEALLLLPLPRIESSDKLRNLPTAALNHTPAHRAEWQSRLNPALALMIFVLLLPFLARAPVRSGRHHRLLPTFLLFAAYSNGLDALIIMMKKEKIPFIIGAYSLHLLFILLFVLLYFHATRSPPRA